MRTTQKSKSPDRRLNSETANEANENQTKKIPNMLVFFGLGLASILGQAAVQRYIKKRFLGPIFGMWGPVFLILGLFNKMVKLEDKLIPSSQRGSLH